MNEKQHKEKTPQPFAIEKGEALESFLWFVWFFLFSLGLLLILFTIGSITYNEYKATQIGVNDLTRKEMVLDSIWKIDTLHRNHTPATDYFATWQSEKYIQSILEEEYNILYQIPLGDTATYYFLNPNFLDKRNEFKIRHLIYKDTVLIDWTKDNKIRKEVFLPQIITIFIVAGLIFIVFLSIYSYFLFKKIKKTLS